MESQDTWSFHNHESEKKKVYATEIFYVDCIAFGNFASTYLQKKRSNRFLQRKKEKVDAAAPKLFTCSREQV